MHLPTILPAREVRPGHALRVARVVGVWGAQNACKKNRIAYTMVRFAAPRDPPVAAARITPHAYLDWGRILGSVLYNFNRI